MSDIDLITERPVEERRAEDVEIVTSAALQWAREVASRHCTSQGIPLDLRDTLGEAEIIKSAVRRLREEGVR